MSTTTPTLSDYELEHGKPMPSTVHAFIQGNLIFSLKSRYRQDYHVLPELSLALTDQPTVPDIAIYAKFDIDLLQDVVKRKDAPLAIIEILSPTQALDTLVEKTLAYFEMGVKSCWLVLPSLRAVAVYHQPHRYTFFSETDTLEDRHLKFSLPLAEVFSAN